MEPINCIPQKWYAWYIWYIHTVSHSIHEMSRGSASIGKISSPQCRWRGERCWHMPISIPQLRRPKCTIPIEYGYRGCITKIMPTLCNHRVSLSIRNTIHRGNIILHSYIYFLMMCAFSISSGSPLIRGNWNEYYCGIFSIRTLTGRNSTRGLYLKHCPICCASGTDGSHHKTCPTLGSRSSACLVAPPAMRYF